MGHTVLISQLSMQMLLWAGGAGMVFDTVVKVQQVNES